jgi:hypothetical protein
MSRSGAVSTESAMRLSPAGLILRKTTVPEWLYQALASL